ncbi:hypothetical protein [Faucicola atlantae]|uniref:Uncharacterized protein n=1 Tax=Faucicola atlantae TaxID=34059 RepID=A0A1B8QGL4_9GAMM|nr:hypothetical protein [Moraxella atlantae]OBX81368.1 hypothetical protein A9306_06465 [Moraxella atlantae]
MQAKHRAPHFGVPATVAAAGSMVSNAVINWLADRLLTVVGVESKSPVFSAYTPTLAGGKGSLSLSSSSPQAVKNKLAAMPSVNSL